MAPHSYGVIFGEGLADAFNDPYSVMWLSGPATALNGPVPR